MIKKPFALERALFFIFAFIFVSFVVGLYNVGQILVLNGILSAFLVLCFVLFSTIYLSDFKLRRQWVLRALFCLGVVDFVMLGLLLPQTHTSALVMLLSSYGYFGTYFVILLPVFFLAFFGGYLYQKGYTRIAIGLFLAMVLLLGFYYLSGLVLHQSRINDEEFILLFASKALLSLANPYSVHVPSQLFSNISSGLVSQPTITMQNTLVGNFEYPAFYLLSFLPFYLLSGQSLGGALSFGFGIWQLAFLLFAIFAIILVVDKKYFRHPAIWLIVFTTIMIGYISSIAFYLMFGLLAIAYYKLDHKYSYVALGLCASLQQLMWIPVLLLLVYVFRNQGTKIGIVKTLGTVGVFVLLNGYFIALNPVLFAQNIFTTIGGQLWPNVQATFGYVLLQIYPIGLGAFFALFCLALLLVVMLFYHLNRKELVGIFSIVPFLFNSHATGVYYAFFVAFCVLTLHMRGFGKKREAKKQDQRFVAGSVLILFLIGSAYVYFAHLSYLKNFNIYSDPAQLAFASNQTIYSTNLHYSNLANSTVYVAALGISKYQGGYEGLLNVSILNSSQNCSSYPCAINRNVIRLNGTGSYPLKLHLPKQGYNEPAYGARLILYNSDYFYESDGTFNQTILSSFSPP